MKYDHKKIEKKWEERWEKEKINQPDMDEAKKPYFNLMMFPYPSAEGLHVGNMYAFTGSDIWGRYKSMKGFSVFEPMGLDGFGIHSENYAIKIGEHIGDVSKRTEKHFYEQLRMTGIAFDWSRTVETYKPNYYKWTQWLFVQMFKNGLAFRKKATVNWCPSCKTVLADEQVEDGQCERCKSETTTKDMEQWFWRITDYAERLNKNLEWINWSEEVKVGQKNWIGRSEGINISYDVNDSDKTITCFTSYPETNFGATFIVLAPEYENILSLTKQEYIEDVKNYITEAKKKSDIERISEGRKKTGVFTGSYCKNPLTGLDMPVYVTDFVLANVGTGAVVGVPAHDVRDYEFAKEFDLEIIRVMKTYDGDGSKIEGKGDVNHEGIMVNSDFLNGMDHKKARETIMDYIEKKGWGERKINYKLRDWCISRQRYWGDPIPMIHCKKCGWLPVPEEDLPVMLPEIEKFEDILPDGSGKGPLAKQEDYVRTKCPKCKGDAERETDVMDPFVDSSWYFLRYPSTEFDDVPFAKARTKKWLPVDMYIGGKEHTVLHLLYSRFITMALKDWGYIEFDEPFDRFFGHGLLIKEGAKMSKSKGNVINPDEYIDRFGADAVRLYLMFLGDFEQGGDWRDTGMEGMSRFVKRIYRVCSRLIQESKGKGVNSKFKVQNGYSKSIHKCIQGVEKDIKRLSYNTAIAKLMIFFNGEDGKPDWRCKINSKGDLEEASDIGCGADLDALGMFAKLLAPFAPYIAEEIWSQLGHGFSVHQQSWPAYDKDLIKEDEVEIAVQINGKLRDTIKIQSGASEEEVEKLVKESERVKKYLTGKVKKVIFVENKIINFVI
ncbi:MAG: leucine--tRNA ligase [Candidatus Dojkabacteria bacterium]|nr:leucine--tRNA ligase [Candidatus Dojkabacteria bacterium]